MFHSQTLCKTSRQFTQNVHSKFRYFAQQRVNLGTSAENMKKLTWLLLKNFLRSEMALKYQQTMPKVFYDVFLFQSHFPAVL